MPARGQKSSDTVDFYRAVCYNQQLYNAKMRKSSGGPPAQRAPGLLEGGEASGVNTPRSGGPNREQ